MGVAAASDADLTGRARAGGAIRAEVAAAGGEIAAAAGGEIAGRSDPAGGEAAAGEMAADGGVRASTRAR